MSYGSKANLIVDDDVQVSAGGVTLKLTEVQRLLNNAFPANEASP